MARISGLSRPTVYTGVRELDQPPDPQGRIRRPGGGPKRAVERQPGLLQALDELVDPDTRGDPESPLRWTCKSTRQLADALAGRGFQVSDDTVGRLLKQQRYTLQRTLKTQEGAQHPDRDQQFRYVNEQAKAHLTDGQPVVSVDTKKKELVGRYANGGAEWQPTGWPERVGVHDFPDPTLGKAIPYGVYDLGANTGWVSVGCDHDTAAFAVASLRRWWETMGKALYPTAGRLLVTADAGGSNGYRIRAWKTELAGFAAETGLQVTVCHFPPGTSKWNKIERRLFSHISMNWRGRPLISHEVIAATQPTLAFGCTPSWTAAATRWASRSPTASWLRCRCGATTGMGSGTTPSCPLPHSHTPEWDRQARPVDRTSCRSCSGGGADPRPPSPTN
jgi:hypothetical protein